MLYYVCCSLFRFVYKNLEKKSTANLIKISKTYISGQDHKNNFENEPPFWENISTLPTVFHLRIRGLLLEAKYLNQNPRCKVSYYKGHFYKITMKVGLGIDDGWRSIVRGCF